ncbi:MAG: hypothetical protein M3539_17860 [Acidobacteriota bacterium]|nr:hypothetical protein [Acidobacteriota bacterium]
MATAEHHNKYLALAHIAFAVFSLSLIIGWSCFLYFFWGIGTMPKEQATFMMVGLLLVGVLNFLAVAPSLIAGWALLRRKGWAKNASLLAAVAGAMYFPFGPFVCGYSFWFFFNEPGRSFYKQH